MTVAKFKPLIFFVSGFALSNGRSCLIVFSYVPLLGVYVLLSGVKLGIFVYVSCVV
jgi:hypothetical protein